MCLKTVRATGTYRSLRLNTTLCAGQGGGCWGTVTRGKNEGTLKKVWASVSDDTPTLAQSRDKCPELT